MMVKTENERGRGVACQGGSPTKSRSDPSELDLDLQDLDSDLEDSQDSQDIMSIASQEQEVSKEKKRTKTRRSARARSPTQVSLGAQFWIPQLL